LGACGSGHEDVEKEEEMKKQKERSESKPCNSDVEVK
jgi:hypothetical protein